jgi:hypothetical protein
MNAALTGSWSQPTQDDLFELGFSPEQIQILVRLRDDYPYIEFLDNRKEWERLRFMKWLVSHQERQTS